MRTLSTNGLWNEAWALMKSHYWTLVAASAAVVAVAILGGCLSLLVSDLDYVASVLIEGPLIAGLMLMGVRHARGPTPQFEDLWAGFRRYWPLVGIAFIKQAINFVVLELPELARAASSPGSPGGAGSTAFSCGVVPIGIGVMIFFGIRLWLADQFVLDETLGRLGTIDAIKAAWRVSGRNFGPMFSVGLAMSLILVGTLLLAGVGVVFLGLPLITCAFGVMYTRLMGPLPPTVCSQCGYDRTGLAAGASCPECGLSPA